MPNITWTKSWASSDDGTILTGQHLADIQANITTVVNGNLTNANWKASPSDAEKLAEAKVLFDTTTGHHHDGSDSRLVATPAKNYRTGMHIYGTDHTVIVRPGAIDIDGTILASTADATALTISTATDWMDGSVGSITDTWVYVYVADNPSGTLEFKLHGAPPNLSDADDHTTEIPYRYRKNAAATRYYRCIGSVFADSDSDFCFGQASAKGLAVTQFDASPNCIGWVMHNNDNPMKINTLWTPKFIDVQPSSAEPPANGQAIYYVKQHKDLLDDYTLLGYAQAAPAYVTASLAGCVESIVEQSTSAAGGFNLKQTTDGLRIYYIAWTDEV